MTKIIAKRVHAGVYTYTLGEHIVRVEDREPNPAFGDTKTMWMAIAVWDENGTYSDPVESKWEAVEIAHQMLRARPRTDEIICIVYRFGVDYSNMMKTLKKWFGAGSNRSRHSGGSTSTSSSRSSGYRSSSSNDTGFLWFGGSDGGSSHSHSSHSYGGHSCHSDGGHGGGSDGGCGGGDGGGGGGD